MCIHVLNMCQEIKCIYIENLQSNLLYRLPVYKDHLFIKTIFLQAPRDIVHFSMSLSMCINT